MEGFSVFMFQGLGVGLVFLVFKNLILLVFQTLPNFAGHSMPFYCRT